MGISKEFVMAGDAIFTIETPDQGHRTYRIQKVEGSERYPADAYFAKLLTGPDNTRDYTYLGKLTNGAVTVTAKSQQWNGTYPLRLLNRVLARVWADDHAAYENHGYRVHHEGRCGRCGRTLTVPESVESGIGPECARKMAGN
jgi:hypothetical protein